MKNIGIVILLILSIFFIVRCTENKEEEKSPQQHKVLYKYEVEYAKRYIVTDYTNDYEKSIHYIKFTNHHDQEVIVPWESLSYIKEVNKLIKKK